MDPTAVDRNLLFGLLALQIGLIDHDRLMTAFRGWTRDKSRAMADYLADGGGLDTEDRAAVEVLVDRQLKKHGGSAEKSLAAIPADRSTRACLAQIGDADVQASLVHLNPASTRADDDGDLTATYSVGAATSDGQRFHVLRPHARGGLGAVFVALDQELNREVALKQILDQHADDPVSRQRFLLEAQVTGGLEHPGVVPVYGLGTYADGRPYYAMRFIRGDSLKEAIESFHARHGKRPAGSVERREADRERPAVHPPGSEDSGPDGRAGVQPVGFAHPGRQSGQGSLELRKLLRRFVDVCNAIDYAHSRGILHRDIKPANIILGKHGETLVVDWGLAKPIGRNEAGLDAGERTLVPKSGSGSSTTLPGSALGTPAYMSPEQAEGNLERLGPRSDVYSLGATLYCLLTGKPPLEGDVADVIRGVQQGRFVPPRQLDATIDRALESVCLKAMALKPEDRYGSPKALAEDVERWMADEPVSAWREPWIRALSRWLARHRAGVTAAGAAVVVALAGTGAVLAVQTRANLELRSANADLALANAKVTLANSELAASNERERARFALAQEAIRTFHTGVSEDILLKQEQFKALRTKLLRGAREFYQRLEGFLQGKDRDSRLALGRAYLEVSELTRQLDSVDEASLVLRRALDLFEGLSRENPADEESQRGLALGERALSIIKYMVGQEDEGFAAELRSRELFRALAAGHPDDRQLRRDWAESERHIAASLDIRDRRTEAIEAIERARGILATSDKQGPPSDAWEAELLEIHGTRAMILGDSGRSDEALAAYEQAREFGEELFRRRPEDPRTSHELARTLGNRGGFLLSLGRRADALASYERALDVLRAAGGANPNVFLFPAASAWIEFGRAGELVALGRDAEALEGLLRARTAREILVRANPAVVRNRTQLLGVNFQISGIHRRAGRMPQAIESLERARDQAASLLDSHPAEREYQRYLVSAYSELGDLHAALRHEGRVRECFDKALAIARQLDHADAVTPSLPTDVAQTTRRRGSAWQKCGRSAQAASDFRESIALLRGAKSPGPADYYNIACALSLLSGVASESTSGLSAADGRAAGDEAMRSLHQAAAGGWRGVAALRADPDLAPIRSRLDFQMLVLDIAFPADPFAATN
jgi:serine/threonine-protein kinase